MSAMERMADPAGRGCACLFEKGRNESRGVLRYYYHGFDPIVNFEQGRPRLKWLFVTYLPQMTVCEGVFPSTQVAVAATEL
jgi:hypothetical protein